MVVVLELRGLMAAYQHFQQADHKEKHHYMLLIVQLFLFKLAQEELQELLVAQLEVLEEIVY